MKRIWILFLVLVCCSGLVLAQKVVFNYERGTDFSKFHTYKWVTIEGSSGISQITAQNITTIINTELAQKGFVQVMGDGPADIYVGYQASVDQQKQLNWYNSGGPWMGGFGSASESTIDVGTLVFDVYSPAGKTLIWRGTATKTLNPSGDPQKNYQNLQKAVEKLLKGFPPNEKK